MARALWLLALLSAFFVVAVRCLCGAMPAGACAAAGAEARAVPLSSNSEDEPAAAADLDDDSDDSADPEPALAAAPPVRLVLFADTSGTGLECGALVAQRALPSHAPSLERPPRV